MTTSIKMIDKLVDDLLILKKNLKKNEPSQEFHDWVTPRLNDITFRTKVLQYELDKYFDKNSNEVK